MKPTPEVAIGGARISMTAASFVDRNVVLYADDTDAGPKRDVARALLTRIFSDGSAVVPVQVLHEYFSAATSCLGLPAIARAPGSKPWHDSTW